MVFNSHKFSPSLMCVVVGGRKPNKINGFGNLTIAYDYLIEREVFECYAPKDGTSVRNKASGIQRKIEEGQTKRIISNLDDWHSGGGNIADLIKQLNDWPIEGLEEVKIVNQYHEVIDISIKKEVV